MSKKNSSVILKNCFEDFQDLSEVYKKFAKKIETLRSNFILVAVSGGPDSLALTALSKAHSYKKKIKFEYVLVNHNIRKNSLKEANQVKNLLKKKNIKLKILNNEIKVKRNIQNNARNIRYDLLKEYCAKKGISTILTAHNLEDQVETFFIRLSRGSGLTGLSAMSPLSKLSRNLYLVRPLLDVKKKILIKFSKIIFGGFIKDPSNINKKYLRTKVRSLQKPLKQSGINYEQIIKSINNLASSKATLEEYFTQIFKKTVKISKKTIRIDLKKFRNLNNEIKIKIINYSIKNLKKNYYNPRSQKVLNLIKSIDKGNFNKSTLGGCIFVKKDNLIFLKLENK